MQEKNSVFYLNGLWYEAACDTGRQQGNMKTN